MIHKKIEQVEKEYLDKRKEYQQVKEQLEDYRRISKRKTYIEMLILFMRSPFYLN